MDGADKHYVHARMYYKARLIYCFTHELSITYSAATMAIDRTKEKYHIYILNARNVSSNVVRIVRDTTTALKPLLNDDDDDDEIRRPTKETGDFSSLHELRTLVRQAGSRQTIAAGHRQRVNFSAEARTVDSNGMRFS